MHVGSHDILIAYNHITIKTYEIDDIATLELINRNISAFVHNDVTV